MAVWATLGAGAVAGGAVFWLVLWRGFRRQSAAAIAIVASLLLLPFASLFVEPRECDDIACGFLLFIWLWRSGLLLIGAAIGVFASHLSPWGAE